MEQSAASQTDVPDHNPKAEARKTQKGGQQEMICISLDWEKGGKVKKGHCPTPAGLFGNRHSRFRRNDGTLTSVETSPASCR